MTAWMLVLALAQPAAPTNKRAASEHFAKGQKLYKAERYEQALAEFKAGYAAYPLPGFLINIGQTYRQMGERQKARTAYQQYLDIQPEDDKMRPQVEKMIEDIDREDRVAAEATAAPPPPKPDLEVHQAPTPPPAAVAAPAPVPEPAHEEKAWYSRWWVWAGAGALVAGGIAAGMALSSDSSTTTTGSLGVLDARK